MGGECGIILTPLKETHLFMQNIEWPENDEKVNEISSG
jgi:hypothetical protein